jgi:PEP-CTERM motif
MNKFKIAALALATAIAITPSASANNIPAGLFSLGPLVATTSGSLTNGTVTANYTENVFDYSGGLAFEYNVTNGSPATDIIDAMSTNYGAFSDSALRIEWLSGDAVTGNYALNAAGTVSIDFANDLGTLAMGGSGDLSSTFILFTNASVYGTGDINFIDNATASGSALVPVATPEPGSLLFLGTGLLGLAFLAFRKAKAKSSSGGVMALGM